MRLRALIWRVLPVQDFDEEGTRSPGKRPSVTLRLSSSMLMSPASAATAADDSDADEATRVRTIPS